MNLPRKNNLSYLKQRRKDLRNNLTPAEVYLWTKLKGDKFKGRRFRRQFSIENYIVDFCCPSEKVIIELDGQVHFNSIQSANDFDRDERLQELGYKVLRFENKLVFEHLDYVLEEIEKSFNSLPRR